MIILNYQYWEVKKTINKGRGIFAKQIIKKGSMIAEYKGTFTPFEDVDWDKYEDYVMFLNDSSCIVPDLTKIGAHLINHSCNPNCVIQKKEGRIYFVSLRLIKANEEITINYKYPPKFGECLINCKHKCVCGDTNCRGDMHQG
jgi:uncharacterized protein